MNQFQKNVVFISLVACLVGGGAYAVNYSMQEHRRQLEERRAEARRHLEEQKVEWRKANLKAVRELSVIGALSTEEQIRVDNAGDDFERLQLVLLDIHQERSNHWANRLEEIEEKKGKLQRFYNQYSANVSLLNDPQLEEAATTLLHNEKEAAGELLGFRAGLQRLRSWRPITFEDYCAKQSGDSKLKTEPQAEPKATERTNL